MAAQISEEMLSNIRQLATEDAMTFATELTAAGLTMTEDDFARVVDEGIRLKTLEAERGETPRRDIRPGEENLGAFVNMVKAVTSRTAELPGMALAAGAIIYPTAINLMNGVISKKAIEFISNFFSTTPEVQTEALEDVNRYVMGQPVRSEGLKELINSKGSTISILEELSRQLPPPSVGAPFNPFGDLPQYMSAAVAASGQPLATSSGFIPFDTLTPEERATMDDYYGRAGDETPEQTSKRAQLQTQLLYTDGDNHTNQPGLIPRMQTLQTATETKSLDRRNELINMINASNQFNENQELELLEDEFLSNIQEQRAQVNQRKVADYSLINVKYGGLFLQPTVRQDPWD